MTDIKPHDTKHSVQKQQKLIKQLGSKVDLKLTAKSQKNTSVWFGFGMMGVIGWSIAVPTLLGVSLGIWIDKNYLHERSWTLALLLAGLAIGCFTAWTWISKEYAAMHSNNRNNDKNDD